MSLLNKQKETIEKNKIHFKEALKVINMVSKEYVENQLEDMLKKKEKEQPIAILALHLEKGDIIFENVSIKIKYGKKLSFYLGTLHLSKKNLLKTLGRQFLFQGKKINNINNFPFNEKKEDYIIVDIKEVLKYTNQIKKIANF